MGEAGGKEDSRENEGVEQALEAEVVGTVDCAVEFCGELQFSSTVAARSCDVLTYVVPVIWLMCSNMMVIVIASRRGHVTVI